MTAEQLGRVLVVEDHPRARATLCGLLERMGAECRACEGYEQALRALGELEPDVIVLDYCLGSHSGRDLLVALRTRPVLPAVVIVSAMAQAPEAFELAQLGARAFVTKPVTPEALERALEHALRRTPDLVPAIRNAVGHIPIHAAQQLLRETMVTTALGKSRGNRSGAARVLQISRQLLQHMIRSLDDGSIGAAGMAVPVDDIGRRR